MNPNSKSISLAPPHSSIFIWLFALASIWHYTSSGNELVNYWAHFDPVVTPLIAIAVIASLVVAVYPDRTPALLAFSLAHVTVIGVRFPIVADHLVMELFLHLSILGSFAYLSIRRQSTDVSVSEIFELFSPIGRWLLIVMYFYGTFHKFNPGFMSLESSCAIPFIDGFPLPAAFLDLDIVGHAAIYGTLILESVAMVLLLSTRTKYYGMLLGMTFHFLIGISTFGTLAHFSAFALALHTLFLPSSIGERFHNDPIVPGWMKSVTGFRIVTIAIVMLQVLFALHMLTTREGFLVNLLFATVAIALMILVLKHGQVRPQDARYRLRSPLAALHVIPIMYFVYCLSPYIGLGTGGVLAMFSGLRTEGGISNHFVIREPVRLFHYQDKIVYFDAASNVSLQSLVEEEQGMTLFDFQRHFMTRDTLILPFDRSYWRQVYLLDSRLLSVHSPKSILPSSPGSSGSTCHFVSSTSHSLIDADIEMDQGNGNPVILFDGVCNLCESTVQLVIRNDRAGRYRFASLQSEAAGRLLRAFDYECDELNSVLLIRDGKLYRKARAALQIARFMDRPWPLLYFLLGWIPSLIVDPVYDFIGNRRYKWFGKKESCWIPSDELMSRFLDDGVSQ